MDVILFVLMFCCLLLVAGWYVGNEIMRAKGGWGILGVDADRHRFEREHQPSKYRFKDDDAPGLRKRILRFARSLKDPSKDYHSVKKKGSRFRDKHEAAYNTRGPLPRFNERPKR